ncbi:hypothetical protein BJV74DRAFT_863049 [Russula compacta]|nr:hypothetical protein BJV74DRAFT_863049 [Russula compacta]
MTSYPTGGNSQHYGGNTQHEAYNDPPQFDLYNPHAPHETYDPTGYREPYTDEPSYSLPQAQSTEPLEQTTKEVPYAEEEFNPTARRPRSSRNVRAWRYQQGRRLWTQGSGPRCLCRFFCCTVFITIFLVVVIVLNLALWIQPPDLVIGGGNNSSPPVVAQGVNLLSDGLQVNLGFPVEVINPNYFSVKLTRVDAQIFYPINNTLIGNGTLNDVNLPAHANTNFTFPFSIDYHESLDPNFAIITDIANKCLGNPQSDLTIRYKIVVGVRIFFITISPTISNSISFACPISTSDIESLMKQLGLDIKSILGGNSSLLI